MGAQLVAQALIYALPKLEPNKHDRARVVLLIMCHRAMDKDRNPTYFAGSDDLAVALGLQPPPPADFSDEAIKRRRRASRAVERAIAQLVAAGLIAQVGRTSARGKRRWALNLPLLDVHTSTESSTKK